MARAENRAPKVTGKGAWRGGDSTSPKRPVGVQKPHGSRPATGVGKALHKSGVTGKGRAK